MKQENRQNLVRFENTKLPKESILRLDADFLRIKEKGAYRNGKVLRIGFYRDVEQTFKVAFIAGKKVHNKANKRNWVKRRLRESLRLIRSKIMPDCHLIIIARREIFEKNTAEIQQELIYLLKKSQLWNDEENGKLHEQKN